MKDQEHPQRQRRGSSPQESAEETYRSWLGRPQKRNETDPNSKPVPPIKEEPKLNSTPDKESVRW